MQGCLNWSARIKCMFIGQLSALQNVHLWGCLSLQELNVCLFVNWMHLKNFNCGNVWIQVQELDVCLYWPIDYTPRVHLWRCSNLEKLIIHLLANWIVEGRILPKLFTSFFITKKHVTRFSLPKLVIEKLVTNFYLLKLILLPD